MNAIADDDRQRGIALLLAGVGALLAIAPQVVSLPQRPALYAGTLLLVAGIVVLFVGQES